MSRDSWERLVAAVLRREQLWQLFHEQSRTPSISSISSDDLTANSCGEILNLNTPSLGIFLHTPVYLPSGHGDCGEDEKMMWTHIRFEHPATFDTLAMNSEMKEHIMNDLITFTKAKDYYMRIGKPWKRGYLLYGPPGTGKSTLIAAIANFLRYDLYVLELTAVKDNNHLRKLMAGISQRAIVMIEDIDCSPPITSELLSFMDVLWSASGEERIFVLTTNYIEKIDKTVIRRGRMDIHIEMSYCRFEAFKVLAKNYLDLDSHEKFEMIRCLLEEINISPADVAENLMPKSAKMSAEECLENLITALHNAKEEAKNREATEPKSGCSQVFPWLKTRIRRLFSKK